MDIPLAYIAPTVPPRDDEIKAAVPGGSGKEGEALSGVGEAPLPPLGFAQLENFNPAQVADWLEDLGFFKELNGEGDMAFVKEEFLRRKASGALLLETGFDMSYLMRGFSFGEASRLSIIIKRVYRDAGISPPSFTNMTNVPKRPVRHVSTARTTVPGVPGVCLKP